MKLTPALQGDRIVVAVQGGFARHPAPLNGIQVEDGERVCFLSLRDLEVAIVDLQMLIRRGRRRR